MTKTTSALADHYMAIGREEKAVAIRTWLTSVKKELEKELNGLDVETSSPMDRAELVGGVVIVSVLLDRMNEASDAPPAPAGE